MNIPLEQLVNANYTEDITIAGVPVTEMDRRQLIGCLAFFMGALQHEQRGHLDACMKNIGYNAVPPKQRELLPRSTHLQQIKELLEK